MKHKHAEYIKQWVDGVECQWWCEYDNKWRLISFLSDFCPEVKVRIKPAPKSDLVDYVYVHDNFGHSDEVARMVWSSEKSGNLKLIWDGDTGILKSAEVVKNV